MIYKDISCVSGMVICEGDELFEAKAMRAKSRLGLGKG